MKTNFITKLFYRKYPFKIAIYNSWISDTKYKLIEDFHTIVKNKKNISRFYSDEVISFIKSHLPELKKLYKFIESGSVKTRYDYNSLSLFIDNKQLFDDMCRELSPLITSVSIPPSDKILQELLNKNRIEIMNSLKYDCRYKVFLSNKGKNILRKEVKENFLNLTKRYKDQFVIPYSTLYYLEKEIPSYYYLNNCFFYVKDSKMLTLTQMMIQPVIKEVISMFTYEEIENKDSENE
jgi:hypothetical protein